MIEHQYIDQRIERERLANLADALDRSVGDQADGDAALVVRTFAETSYPTTAQVFYACKVLDPTGSELEGAAGTLDDTGAVIYAFNAGSAKPPEGTELLAVHTGDRWVIQFNG